MRRRPSGESGPPVAMIVRRRAEVRAAAGALEGGLGEGLRRGDEDGGAFLGGDCQECRRGVRREDDGGALQQGGEPGPRRAPTTSSRSSGRRSACSSRSARGRMQQRRRARAGPAARRRRQAVALMPSSASSVDRRSRAFRWSDSRSLLKASARPRGDNARSASCCPDGAPAAADLPAAGRMRRSPG